MIRFFLKVAASIALFVGCIFGAGFWMGGSSSQNKTPVVVAGFLFLSGLAAIWKFDFMGPSKTEDKDKAEDEIEA